MEHRIPRCGTALFGYNSGTRGRGKCDHVRFNRLAGKADRVSLRVMSWTHLHLALNHVPVLGTPFLLLLLVVGLVRRSEEIKRVALWGFILLTIVAIPIKFTGDFAAEEVGEEPWMLPPYLEQHETAADQATTGVFLLGIAAVVAVVLGRKARPVPAGSLIVVLVFALVTTGLMLRTANLGGQLRHAEIRDTPATR
jgi:uncharacterized membrane protein